MESADRALFRISPGVLKESGWLLLGHALFAAAQLMGTRMITELVDPATFGSASLLLGISTLGLSVGCFPFLQAALRFYHDVAGTTGERALRRVVGWLMARSAAVVILILLMGGAFLARRFGIGYAAFPLLAGLLVVDLYRTFECDFLNAAQRQRVFGLWMGLDACARWAGAIGAVLIAGRTAENMILGYLAGSGCIALIFGAVLALARSADSLRESPVEDAKLAGEVTAFAAPLMPLGAASWARSLGDRYVIGGLLGVGAAGSYSAVQGLACRPFIEVQAVIERTARPHYFGAVAAGEWGRAARILGSWAAVVAAIVGAGAIALAFLAVPLGKVLLGPAFREAAGLMPWIGLGYAFFVVGAVFEKVAHARKRTGWVLGIHAAGAVLGLAISIPFIQMWGLLGAAVAVPVGMGLQFMMTLAVAKVLGRA